LDFLKTFPGNKYAQIIAHSGQPDRFADSAIATAFEQAKELDVRYIEPWYEEYKNRNIDSLLYDFNCWVDSCNSQTSVEILKYKNESLLISPNPASEYIEISQPSEGFKPSEGSEIKIYNALGECVRSVETQNFVSLQRIEISQLPVGLYFIQIGNYSEKFVVAR
jgi:hypothetical protein